MAICYNSHRKWMQASIPLLRKSHPLGFPASLITWLFHWLPWFPLWILAPCLSPRSLGKTTHCKTVYSHSAVTILKTHLLSICSLALKTTIHVKRLCKILKLFCCCLLLSRNSSSGWSSSANRPALTLKKFFFCHFVMLIREITCMAKNAVAHTFLFMKETEWNVCLASFYFTEEENAGPLPGYLFYWADLLSGLTCMFDSPTCQDVANMSVSSCKWCNPWLGTAPSFSTLHNDCCRVNWYRGLDFAEASGGQCDMN